jgi:hypothetical protein
METSSPSKILRRDIITDATIAKTVNDSDSDKFEIGEDQSDEEPI